jgi:hypothetical protein
VGDERAGPAGRVRARNSAHTTARRSVSVIDILNI